MPKKPVSAPGRSSVFARLRRAISRSSAGRGWRRSRDLGLWQRSLGFAALGLLTLVPLLMVVSAADPARGRGFAQWLGEGLGVAASSRVEVERLFGRPGQALRTTTAFGIASLAVFGLTFAAAVQTGYEKVWDLSPARWFAKWRQIVWLAVLVGYIFLSATTTLRRESLAGALGAALSAVLLLWWSQRFLLGGRIGWMALLPGAVATVVGLIGLRIFSRLVFSPLIASNALAYGPIGTVLVIQSWLVGVGVVVFGGAVVGRLVLEEWPRVAHRLRRRKEPGPHPRGGPEAEAAPRTYGGVGAPSGRTVVPEEAAMEEHFVWVTTRRVAPGALEEFGRAWRPDPYPKGLLRAFAYWSEDGQEITGVSFWDSEEACDSWRASGAERRRREAMAPYVVGEREGFYRGRELAVPER